MAAETVEQIIIGLPKNWDESDTHGTAPAEAAIKRLIKEFPAIPVLAVDERYTSKMAKDAMLQMGMKKKTGGINGSLMRLLLRLCCRNICRVIPS